MEALAEAERLECLRAEAELVRAAQAREEAERAEAERLEAEWLEARRAEAARSERVIVVSEPAPVSDSRISSVEKALEKVQEEQAVIKQKLDQQEASNANMQNMLLQILAKLSGPSSSQP